MHGLVVSLLHVLMLGQSLIHVCSTLVPTHIAMTTRGTERGGLQRDKGREEKERYISGGHQVMGKSTLKIVP